MQYALVLNLVISGIPSILASDFDGDEDFLLSFKPCYKWNTFNTKHKNLGYINIKINFKPCYKWNTFNTLDFDKSTDFMVS